jgi:uncharacterized protein YuzE
MKKNHISYDELSDTLVIAFEPGQPATGIELNEHIILRIDKEKRRAIGLTFLDYSLLAQTADYGPRSFPMPGLARLPEELRALVLTILQTEPVSDILTLSTYTPSYTESIPITSFHHIPTRVAG